MDHYIVSARKYRPSTFRSVVGQEALTTTLKNAITGNKLAHAYLFSGPRGVGKTTCARIFAKTINCLNLTEEHEACNACESCMAFNEQRSYNIHELDAASNNSVEDIRSLIDQVRIPPQIGNYKVYIVDEVHMLSTAAFNSFLKTLEEPPSHAIFILATTEKHKIIPTILSRCQVYDFNRIRISDIVHHLQYVAKEEGIEAEVEALNVIAQKADGGMRDALSIFDQIVSYTGGSVTYKAVIDSLNVLDYEYYFKLTDGFLQGNVVDCLLILNEILNRGFEGQYIISGISTHFRNLLVSKDDVTAQLFQVGASIKQQYVETAKRCSHAFLYRAMEIANECDINYRLSKNKRLLLELTLIRLCQLSGNTPDGEAFGKADVTPQIATIKKDQPTQKKSSEESVEKIKSVQAKEPEPITKPAQPQTKEVPTSPEVSHHRTAIDQTVSPSEPKPGVMSSKTSERKVRPSLGGLGVSISGMSTSGKKVEAKSTPQEKQNGNNPFTEAQLIEVWKMYLNQLTEEKLLRNTMRLYLPKLINDTLFEVEVNTELNQQYLLDNSLSILSFLRENLKNDDITMEIKIAEGNAIKKAMTSREIFDEMVCKNPSLQKLSDEFGLELH